MWASMLAIHRSKNDIGSLLLLNMTNTLFFSDQTQFTINQIS